MQHQRLPPHACSAPAAWVQIDEKLMGELRDIKQAVQPTDTLLVVDAMTGQEAAGLVKSFNDAAELTGMPLLGLL